MWRFKKKYVTESCCFVCKDGGHLLMCDFKSCSKVYHPQCVNRSKEFADSNRRWVCSRHSCFKCRKNATLHCFGCMDSVCKSCIKSEPFVRVRGKNGFCSECLNLALLATQNVDVDSDGVELDFKDRNTYECLFKIYWEGLNEKVGLTLADLHSAEVLMIKENGYNDKSDSVEGNAEVNTVSLLEKNPKPFPSRVEKEKLVLSRKSRKYTQENKLTHLHKKKRAICDKNLQSLGVSKTVTKKKPSALLQSLLTEDLEECGNREKEDVIDDCHQWTGKRKRTTLSRKTEEHKKVLETSEIALPNLSGQQVELTNTTAAADETENNVIEIIDSEDDDDVEPEGDVTPESNIWYYIGPNDGLTYGPFTMSTLRTWWLKGYNFGPEFTIWKRGQSKKAMLLTDALALVYSL